jgi:hypothetical protein
VLGGFHHFDHVGRAEGAGTVLEFALPAALIAAGLAEGKPVLLLAALLITGGAALAARASLKGQA